MKHRPLRNCGLAEFIPPGTQQWALACVVALLAIGTSGLAAPAAAPSGAPLELGVEDCVQLAQSTSDNLTLTELDILLSRADRDLASCDSLPHLNFTPGIRYFTQGGDTEPDIRVDLGRRFLELPQNNVRRKIAQSRLDWARHRKARAQCGLTAQVWRAYLSCLRESRVLEQARAAADLAGRVEAQWNAVTVRNEALDKERRAATQSAQQARLALAHAETTSRQAREILGTLCGIAPGREIVCRKPGPLSKPIPSLEQCQAWARAHRSDLRSARMEYDGSLQNIRLARMTRMPTPEVGFGYGAQNSSSTLDGRDGAYGTLSLRIPLWDAGETAARVRRAQAESEALKVGITRLEGEVAQDVTAKHIALEQALSDREAAAADVAAKEAFEKAEIQRKSGAITEIEFARARVKFLESETVALARDFACHEQAARLLEALEATREDWSGGLPASPEPAQRSDGP